MFKVNTLLEAQQALNPYRLRLTIKDDSIYIHSEKTAKVVAKFKDTMELQAFVIGVKCQH